MGLLADFFLRRTGLLIALIVGMTAVATVGVSRLTIDDVPSSLFRSDDDEFRRLEEVWETFGSDDGDVLMLVRSKQLTRRSGGLALAELTAAAAAVPGVRAVASPTLLVSRGPLGLPLPLWPGPDSPQESWEALESAAAAHPLASGQLLAEDGQAALVVVQFEGSDLPIDHFREPVAALEDLARSANEAGAVDVRLTGIPPLRIVIFDAIRREQTLFAGFGALLGAIVGALVFRHIGPVVVTSAASILAAYWSLGALGLAGQSINLMTTQLPLLILVIAFTDSVHLMMHVLRRREEGMGTKEAGANAIAELGMPCALTSLTTAIGFASLGLSRVQVIQSFGIMFACSVALTFVSVLVVVPLLSTWFLRDGAGPSLSERYAGLHRPAENGMRWVLWRARPVAWIGAAITAGMVLVCLQLVPDNRLTEAVPSGHEAVDTLAAVETHFGGSLWGAALLEWNPSAHGGEVPSDLDPVLLEVEEALAAEPFTHGPLSARALAQVGAGDASALDRVADLPGGVGARMLRPDLGRALVTYRVPDAGSPVAEPAYARLEQTFRDLSERHPGYAMHPTGTGFVARRNVNLIISDFSRGIWLASAIIVAVLALAFRSLRIGLVAVLPNVFPLALAGSVLVALGIELQIAAVLAFTVCLGIAVDDTIHLLARYQSERRAGHSPREAALLAFLHVSRALLATTLVLLAGFGVMFLSSIGTSVLFALIASIGLLAALIGDLLLLPAMLVATSRAGDDGTE